jgi:protein TonB
MNLYQNYSFDDIIFEGRNKEYGAYVLRSESDKNTTKAFIGTLLLVSLLLIFFNTFYADKASVVINKIIVETTDIPQLIIEPKKPAITIPPTSILPPKTIDFREVKPVADNTAPTTVSPTRQDAIQDAAVATVTQTNSSEVTTATSTSSTATETTNSVLETETPVTNTILNISEVLPEFTGGQAALMAFLKKNIRPYDTDIERGISGKVFIRFYIDKNGFVQNPTVLKDNVGGRCAEAALIAIKKMPRWKPGMQNGVPVNVYYTLPVTFNFEAY